MFVKNVSLEHSHTHSVMHYLVTAFTQQSQIRFEKLGHKFYDLQTLKYLHYDLLWNKFVSPGIKLSKVNFLP